MAGLMDGWAAVWKTEIDEWHKDWLTDHGWMDGWMGTCRKEIYISGSFDELIDE